MESIKNLESVKKAGGRWAVLRCLYEVLCEMRLDLSRSIHGDFEVARSGIETGSKSTGDAEILMDWVEGKLIGKAIVLDNIAFWEDLLRKVKKGKLTATEAMKIPFMETVIEKYGFLSYCLPDETEPIDR